MSDSGVAMVVTFVIALVIVSPFAIRVIRRVLADRRARLPVDEVAESEAAATPSPDDIASVLAAIDAGAGGDDGPFEVVVPRSPTVDGRAAPAAVVDAILTDSIRRSGLVVVTDEGGPDGRVLVLRRG